MKKTLCAALVAVLSPVASMAGEISHTYVEAGAGRAVQDAPVGYSDARFDGAYLRGSVEVGRGVYGFGEYARSELRDDFGVDADLRRAQLGIGYARGVSDSTDVIVEGGYYGEDLEGWRRDGARGSVGLRTQFGSRVEGWAKGSYTDAGDYDGDLSAQVGALYRLNPTWGLTGEVDANEDANRYTLGVRASF